MNPVLPDDAIEFGDTARKAFDALGGVDAARKAEEDGAFRAEVAATLQALGIDDIDPRADLDTFCALDHVLVSADGGGFAGVVDRALAALGRTRHVAVSVQSYALAPLVVAGSDRVCTMPRRILERFAADLDVFAPPLALPRTEIFAFWHPRSQADQGHAWLREQLYAAAARAPSGF